MAEIRIVRAEDRVREALTGSGARSLFESWLVGSEHGSPNFDMRYIELEPGGVSMLHRHPWEQANYVLSGRCELTVEGQTQELEAGDFVFIPGSAEHQFVNPSSAEPLVMLCVRGPKDL